ncbi:MAG: serine hydrolase, partial [Actinomycetota bacterium]|nr:serine hydrolase [Actinomycetota bacterium]
MIKRIKSRRERRRFGSGESSPGSGYHSRRLFAKARRRRRSLRVLVVLLVSLVGALLALGYVSSDTAGVGDYLSTLFGEEGASPAVREEEPTGSAKATLDSLPEQTDTSPEAVAYRLVASEIPGMDAETVRSVYRSKLDPSWASVHVEGPEDEGTYVLFLQRDGELWTARRSIRADEPENPEYEKVVLEGVPEDLVDSVYPQSPTTTRSSGLLAEAVETSALPSVEAAEPPTPEAVADEVPEDERERVEEGLEEARREIEKYASGYEGTAGVYVQDLNGHWGYGVNPDETYFSASVIKIPLMVAVFRKVDEGEFSLRDSFETEPGDWAGG